MMRRAKTGLFLIALSFWPGCRPAELRLSEADSKLVDVHVRRISALRPDLEPQERAILEGWLPEFLTSVALWEEAGFLNRLEGCRTLEEYLQAVQRETGTDWEKVLERVFIDWELRSGRRAEEDRRRESKNASMEGFLLVYLEGTAADRDYQVIANVTAEAWKTAVTCLGIREEDLGALKRLAVNTGDGKWLSTEGRIPLFLMPSRGAAPGRTPSDLAGGTTEAGIRLRDSKGVPRLLGEFDPRVECRILYQNSFSLLTLAHEVVHAAAFLALTQWDSLRSDLELKDKGDLERLFRKAVPPLLWNEFVHEGMATAVANRVLQVRRSLLLDKVEANLKSRARARGAPSLAELRRNPRSLWTALFFDHLIERFGGEKIRRLLVSRAPDLEAAVREAFGEDLPMIEKSWRDSLLK